MNGAQTTGAIHAAGATHSKNVSVLARVVIVDTPGMIPAIVAGNNAQNSILAWDRRSNDPVQVRIEHEFQSLGVEYVHRRDSTRKNCFGSGLRFSFIAILTTVVSWTSIRPSVTIS